MATHPSSDPNVIAALQSQLVSSRLQTSNPALYLTIKGLIDNLVTASKQIGSNTVAINQSSGGGGGTGTVTTTGSPANGNLAKFSGPTSITNADLTGDVTTSGTPATTIANNAVTTAKVNNATITYAKIQNISANSKLLGSSASGSGAPPSELSLGSGLNMTGSTLSATGTGGTVTNTGTLTANELIVGNGSADIKAVAATNGQIPIGKTSDGSVNLATITPGSGVSITNGAGSITISTSGGGGSLITAGTYASLPATCTVGDVYFFTDSVYNAAYCQVTNVWTLFLDGKQAVAPGPKSGWTNVNAGSDMTVTDGSGTIDISIVRNATLNLRMITKTATSASIVAAFRSQMITESSQAQGLYFYDGTKAMGIELLSGSGPSYTLRVQKWNSVTSASTTLFTLTRFGYAPTWSGLIYLKITNAASTLGFNWSIDGITWHQVVTEAVGTFITPTGYGVGGANITGTVADPMTISLQSLVAA